MNINQLPQTGQYVKTKFTFINKQKNRDIWKPGVILTCYDHFALVKFDHCKKCFAYDELEEINEKEYQHLLQRNEFKKSLIVADA